MTGSGGLPSGTVTFLFTDVEGSTRLWANEPDAMKVALARHDDVIRHAVESRGGSVFSTAGDAFAAAFPRASDAIEAALSAQDTLGRETWTTSTPIRVRMGLHTGEAEERDGDYFGPAVNLAARVADAGHGGQTLATTVVASVGQHPCRALGEYELRGIEQPVEIIQLGDGDFGRLRVVDADRIALPATPTALIGREEDIAAVRRHLIDAPLVTITGVGGAGKTRLAVEVANAELPGRPDGAYFVDLSSVGDADEVTTAIATALRVLTDSGGPLKQLVSYLQDKRALVILDNCEHVIDACAAFAEAVIATKSKARLLATSRELLNVEGERVVPLGSLPPVAALDLFVDRAVAVDGAFDVGAHHAAVQELCERLDGIPLAIELAAARASVLTAEELLARLDDRFRLLGGTGRRRNRTRTLEATVAWSYDLLSSTEQQVFRALSVFPGSFDVTSAAAVTGLDEIEVLGQLEALTAKSLIVPQHEGGTTRFRLLETLRAFGQARALDADELATVRDRHLTHFVQRFHKPSLDIILDLYENGARAREMDNAMTALEWAIGRERWPDAVALTVACCETWAGMGMAATGRQWIAAVLPHVTSADEQRAAYLRAMDGQLAGLADDWHSAFATYQALLEHDDPFIAIFVRSYLAFVSWAIGDRDAAWTYLTQGEEIASASGISKLTPSLAFSRGSLEIDRGDFSAAAAAFEFGIGADFTPQVAYNAAALATMKVILGDPEAALRMIDEHEHEWALFPFSSIPVVNAAARLALGDPKTAAAEVEAFARQVGLGRIRRHANDALVGIALLCLHEGNRDAAGAALREAAMPRSPHTLALSMHVARKLGTYDELAAAWNQLRATGQRPEGRSAVLRWLETGSVS